MSMMAPGPGGKRGEPQYEGLQPAKRFSMDRAAGEAAAAVGHWRAGADVSGVLQQIGRTCLDAGASQVRFGELYHAIRAVIGGREVDVNPFPRALYSAATGWLEDLSAKQGLLFRASENAADQRYLRASVELTMDGPELVLDYAQADGAIAWRGCRLLQSLLAADSETIVNAPQSTNSSHEGQYRLIVAGCGPTGEVQHLRPAASPRHDDCFDVAPNEVKLFVGVDVKTWMLLGLAAPPPAELPFAAKINLLETIWLCNHRTKMGAAPLLVRAQLAEQLRDAETDPVTRYEQENLAAELAPFRFGLKQIDARRLHDRSKPDFKKELTACCEESAAQNDLFVVVVPQPTMIDFSSWRAAFRSLRDSVREFGAALFGCSLWQQTWETIRDVNRSIEPDACGPAAIWVCGHDRLATDEPSNVRIGDRYFINTLECPIEVQCARLPRPMALSPADWGPGAVEGVDAEKIFEFYRGRPVSASREANFVIVVDGVSADNKRRAAEYIIQEVRALGAAGCRVAFVDLDELQR